VGEEEAIVVIFFHLTLPATAILYRIEIIIIIIIIILLLLSSSKIFKNVPFLYRMIMVFERCVC